MKVKKLLVSMFFFIVVILALNSNKVYAVTTLYWPVPGHGDISRGMTSDHNGIDITDAYVGGAEVRAAIGGYVYRIYKCSYTHTTADLTCCYGFGNGLVIQGDDGRFYQYAHMRDGSIPAEVYYGGRVERGQKLGQVGQTGWAYGEHLHFSISTSSQYWEHAYGVDPLNEVYANRYDTVAPTNLQNLGDNFYAYLTMAENGLYNADRASDVVLENYSTDLNLIWNFVRQADGSYTIKNVSSNLYLDIYGYNDYDGGVVWTYPYNGSTAQKYYIYGNENGYILRAQCLENRVVTVNNGGNCIGNKLNVWFYYPNCPTQLFKINKTELPNTASKLPFEDVKTTDWSYSAIKYMYDNKYISGTSTITFSPETKITRGMVVTILYRMEGIPYVPGLSQFPDVQDTSAYYYVAVKWATQNGIVSGYNNGKFGPNDPITREQLSVILNNYCKYKGKYKTVNANLSRFKDAGEISDYAKWGMNWAVGSGVITGNATEGTLNPQGTATRAEVASMLYKYCLNIK